MYDEHERNRTRNSYSSFLCSYFCCTDLERDTNSDDVHIDTNPTHSGIIGSNYSSISILCENEMIRHRDEFMSPTLASKILKRAVREEEEEGTGRAVVARARAAATMKLLNNMV